MKYIKTLGLLAVAAAATMSSPASASADYVTTTTGGATLAPGTETIHAVNEGGHVTMKSGGVVISCNSTTSGIVEMHNFNGTGMASGALNAENLTFTGCTNFWHVTTELGGRLDVEHTSGHNGTVFSTGAKVRTTRIGINCVYETKNTHIGTVTGGNQATLHVQAAIPVNPAESAEICGTTGSWEGKYLTTSALYVVNS